MSQDTTCNLQHNAVTLGLVPMPVALNSGMGVPLLYYTQYTYLIRTEAKYIIALTFTLIPRVTLEKLVKLSTFGIHKKDIYPFVQQCWIQTMTC